MAISRELTQKLKRIDTDDEDEEEKDEVDILLKNDNEDNMKTESEIDDFIKNYRRYRDEKQPKKEEKKEEKNIEISNEVISKKKEVILGSNKMHSKTNVEKNNDTLQENSNDKNKRESENPCYIAGAGMTSEWHVEECNESNSEMESKLCNKKYKSQNIDEMFDIVEEKLEDKLDRLLQNLKNILNKKSNMKKHEEEEKNEDDLSNLEFESFKQKPILDCPLEETTSRENVQVDKDLTSLKTLANTEQEPTSNSHEVEIDVKKYLNEEPKYLKTQMPDIVTGEEENSEQEEEIDKIMSEAFADDGSSIAEEFRKEQEEEVCNKDFKKIILC